MAKKSSSNVTVLDPAGDGPSPNDLIKLSETPRVARWCRQIIRTNFAGTLVVDGIGVGLAAFGLLNPMVAALIHVSSELAFILNSARVLPRTSKT